MDTTRPIILAAMETFERTVISHGATVVEQYSNPPTDIANAQVAYQDSKSAALQSALRLLDAGAARAARGTPQGDMGDETAASPAVRTFTGIVEFIEDTAKNSVNWEEDEGEIMTGQDISDVVYERVRQDCIAAFHGFGSCIHLRAVAHFQRRVDSPLSTAATDGQKSAVSVASLSGDMVDVQDSDEISEHVSVQPETAGTLIRERHRAPADRTFTWTRFDGSTSWTDYGEEFPQPSALLPAGLPGHAATCQRQPQRSSTSNQSLSARESAVVRTPSTSSQSPSPIQEARSAVSEAIQYDEMSTGLKRDVKKELVDEGASMLDEHIDQDPVIDEPVNCPDSHEFNSLVEIPVNHVETGLQTLSGAAQDRSAAIAAGCKISPAFPEQSKDDVPAPFFTPVSSRAPDLSNVQINSAVATPIFGEKKRKGERKFRSLPGFPIQFSISLKKTSTKPTIVLLLGAIGKNASNGMPPDMINTSPPTDTACETVLIVRFLLPSTEFAGLPIVEAKVEVRIESLGQMFQIAFAMKEAAEIGFKADEKAWKWEAGDRPMGNKPVYRRVAAAEGETGWVMSSSSVGITEKVARPVMRLTVAAGRKVSCSVMTVWMLWFLTWVFLVHLYVQAMHHVA